MAFATGMHVGKYELGVKLGQGGFGLVFAAHDTALDRDVALKFLNPEHTANPEVLQRFLREAKAAAKINHPGVVTVFECGEVTGTNTSADGTAFIAMEMLQGESLTARLARSGRMTAEAAMEIARQVASALDFAHKAGIVHRDLKPDNIFLVADPVAPSGERVKVLDFGIAKLADQAPSSQTHSILVFGTPRYMSPEQCKSAAKADHRSDIYALGCILFELVCGAPPFDGEPGELIAMHQLAPTPRASSIVPDLPEALDSLIDAMLAKNPDQRFPTMAAVQRALEGAGAHSPGLAATLPPGASSSMPRFTPAPGALGVLPGRSSAPMAVAAAIATNPTTLSNATGQTVPPGRGSRKIAIAAGAASGAVVIAIGAWFAFGRRGDEPPPPQPAPIAQPQPAPPPPQTRKPAAITTDLIGDLATQYPTKPAEPTTKPVEPASKPAEPASKPIEPKPAPPALTAAQIEARVRASYLGGLKRCYTAALKKNPNAKPATAIAFRVEANGTVSHVELAGDADFASCARSLAAKWQFPASSASTDVRLPLAELVPKSERKPDGKADKKPCDMKNGVNNPFDPDACAH